MVLTRVTTAATNEHGARQTDDERRRETRGAQRVAHTLTGRGQRVRVHDQHPLDALPEQRRELVEQTGADHDLVLAADADAGCLVVAQRSSSRRATISSTIAAGLRPAVSMRWVARRA